MKDAKGGKRPPSRKQISSVIPHPSSFPFFVGMVTCSSQAEARQLAKAVLEKRLAACVNILNGIESHYWWQGKLETSRECLLLIKTTRRNIDGVTRVIKANHSYEVPEIIFVPFQHGEKRYLKWISDSVE